MIGDLMLEHTTVLTQSQRHWKCWLGALQTHDITLRTEALQQLSNFLDYWTAELYTSSEYASSLRGNASQGGYDTPQESWDEVFSVEDSELLSRSRRRVRAPHVHFDGIESSAAAYGLDETTAGGAVVKDPHLMYPWSNDDGSQETKETLSRYFCGIQRLVIDCPFADVRRTCRKLLDKAKNVEIPSLVHDGPSWFIPITDIIGFKSVHGAENAISALKFQDKYISDVSSEDEANHGSTVDIPRSSDAQEPSATSGYGYYTSPETTPRPLFTTPAIPINAPPRAHLISRNPSTDSISPSLSSRKSTTSNKQRPYYPKQPPAPPDLIDFQISSFVNHGRVTNYAKILLFMPQYVRSTLTCHEKVIGSTKGLPRNFKTYVALMAAAGIGCQYFASYFSAKFLDVGGDSGWLRGVDHTNETVERVSLLNRKIIQCPWAVAREDVVGFLQQDAWTLSEVAVMVVVLTMSHVQSLISLGAGVVCEADVFGGTVWRHSPSDLLGINTPEETVAADGQEMEGPENPFREDLIETLRLRMFTSGHLSPDMSFENLHKLPCQDKPHTAPERRETFSEKIPYPSSTIQMPQMLGPSLFPATTNLEKPINPVIEDLSRFDITHTPSAPTPFPPSHPVLSTKVFSWDDTLQTMQTLLPEIAATLDKRLHLPTTPTFLQSSDLPNHHVDTRPFTDMLSHYSLSLIGIAADDYNPNDDLLNDPLRHFIHKVCLQARDLTKSDWKSLSDLGFSNQEIVEIVVIVAEARFLGVLTYLFRILGKFQFA